jgi:hypothetical protein
MNKVVVLWFMTLSTLLSFSNSIGVVCGDTVEMQPLVGPCPIYWVGDEFRWSINAVSTDRRTEVIREILCPRATNPSWAAME